MPKSFESVSGSFTGDGVSQDITLGFRPDLLVLFNITDGTQLTLFIDGMTDDTAISMVSLISLIAANGITLSATGFDVGSDNSVNQNLKVFKYFAIGGN